MARKISNTGPDIDVVLQAIVNGEPIEEAFKPSNPDVYFALQEVRKAIRERLRLNANPKATKKEKIRSEEAICIATRTLMAKYDGSTLWNGESDDTARRSITIHLECALRAMTIDPDCRNSVESRLSEITNTSRLVIG